MKRILKNFPLVSFYVIACLFTWTCAWLINTSLVFPIIGIFGPAFAAVVVTWASKGNAAVTALIKRAFKPAPSYGWYVFVIILPLILGIATWLLHTVFNYQAPLRLADFGLLSILLAVLVIGEELGWRGFALPLLLKRFPGLMASVITGLMWAGWHIVNFYMPGFPQYETSFVAFTLLTVAYSIFFTFVHLGSAGNVLLAWILHASINLFSPQGLDPGWLPWLKVMIWGLAAVFWLSKTKKLFKRK